MDEQLQQEVRFLTTRLGVIIREQAGERLFRHVERLRRLSKAIRERHAPVAIRAKRRLVASLGLQKAHLVAHAFSLFFQLVNFCEERTRVRRLQSAPAPVQSLLAESIRLRNPYVDSLNYIQIRFLRLWRRSSHSGSAKTEALRRFLALTVHGIAFGMKSTG